MKEFLITTKNTINGTAHSLVAKNLQAALEVIARFDNSGIVNVKEITTITRMN